MTRPSSAAAWRPAETWTLMVLVALAAVSRLPAIAHDLPALYTHDEVSTVETALRFGAGTLQPYSYGHGPLMSYVLAAFYGAWYLGLRLLGVLAGPDQLVLRYFADPTPFYLIHRTFTVALALGLVVLTALIGRRLLGGRAALLAALFTAFANVLFVLALAGREDLLYLFLLLLGVYAGLPILEGRAGARVFVLTGFVVGLATAAKYFGVVGLLFPLVALALRPAAIAERCLALAAGFVGGVVVGMPAAVLGFRAFTRGMTQLASQTSAASYANTSALAGLAYPGAHLTDSVGLPLQVMFLVGALVLVVRDWRVAAYLLAPPLAFLLALASRSGNQASYYVAFVVPFGCLAAARAIDVAMTWTGRRRVLAALVGVVVAGASLAPNVVADLRYLVYLRLPDTRETAKAWIERHLPAGSVLLVETRATDFGVRQGPPLRESLETLRREAAAIRQHGGSGRFWDYKIAQATLNGRGPRYEVVKAHTVRPPHLEAASWQFVVLSLARESDAAARRLVGERHTRLATFESSAYFPGDAFATMRDVAAVSLRPGHGVLRGPTISIWKRNDPAA